MNDFVWSFTTGALLDIIPPTVTSTDPVTNAVGVAISYRITASFSKPMDPTSITSITFNVKQGSTAVPGAVTFAGTIATFTPAVNLAPNQIFTATITTGVKDVVGNTLASNYIFSFTTGNGPDITLPTVNATDPLNNATGIVRNKTVAITFSEAMDPLTISASTFILKQGTTSIAGAVAYSGTTATFDPTSSLVAGTNYTATITTGAKDLAGNALAASISWNFTTGGTIATLAVVNLGAAANYLILAKTAINNISTSALTGDLGLSPAATSYITGLALTNATGYATSAQVTGSIYAADMASPTPINLTTAVNNMITAYNDAAGRPSPDFSELGTGNIGGKTLTPGLYKWTNNVTIPTAVTISGGPNDVWIFQIAGNLTMSSAVNITLTGGAQPKNIFWQVAGQATLGTTAHFEGVLMSMTGITFQTGATMNGRALAQTAVVLDSNTLTKP
ncbi:MAG: ice-binding family protein [Bacteroidota bacterium]